MKKIKFITDENILKRLDELNLSELSKIRGGKKYQITPVQEPPIMYQGYKVGIPI